MPNLYKPCGQATPQRAVWEVARPQGGWLAAVFFPLGYPFPCGPGLVQGRPTAGRRRVRFGQALETMGNQALETMGLQQGVAMDSLTFHPAPHT
jgi:hypothetical protein